MTGTERRRRFAVVDGARFGAAIAVVLFHLTSRSSSAWGRPVETVFPALSQVTAWGAYGVDLFFVVSGFVILMSALRKDVTHFVASRFARLFPAYWVCVLATATLLFFVRDLPSPSVTEVGMNLTMLQSAFGFPNVDGVYWTLWAELRFYLLVGLLVLVGMTRQRVVLFAALWAPLASLAARQEADFLRSLLVYNYAPLFAGGMMLFLLTTRPRSLVLWAVLAENVLIAASVSVNHTGETIRASTVVDPSSAGAAVATVLCFAVVAVAVLTPVRDVSWRWLTTAGLLTYPLYLVHERWGWWLISVLPGSLPPALVLAVAVAACLAAAALVHVLVERPLSGRLRRGIDSSIRELGVLDRGTRPGADVPQSRSTSRTTRSEFFPSRTGNAARILER